MRTAPHSRPSAASRSCRALPSSADAGEAAKQTRAQIAAIDLTSPSQSSGVRADLRPLHLAGGGQHRLRRVDLHVEPEAEVLGAVGAELHLLAVHLGEGGDEERLDDLVVVLAHLDLAEVALELLPFHR